MNLNPWKENRALQAALAEARARAYATEQRSKFQSPLKNIPPHDLERLQQRVSLLAADDPLWARLVALLRRNLDTELEAMAQRGLDDAEAHRARGRAGMLLDLEAQFQQVWAETHRPPA